MTIELTLRNRTNQMIESFTIGDDGELVQLRFPPKEFHKVTESSVSPIMQRQIEKGLLQVRGKRAIEDSTPDNELVD